MKLLSVKKPTHVFKKWFAIFSHQGKENKIEFDEISNVYSYYIKAKHSCGEKFNN